MTTAAKASRMMAVATGVVALAACQSFGTMGTVATGAQCSGNGTVDPASNSGACICTEGYAGSTCDECDAGFQDYDQDGICLPSCPADLACSSLEVCDDTSGTARCTCRSGNTGEGCQKCLPDYADLNGDGSCDKTCALADLDCGAHGVCDDSGSETVCQCNSGYQDNDGDHSCDPDCSSANLACEYGTCDDSSGTVACECDDDHQGTLCDQCKSGYQDNDSNGTCLPTCDTAAFACSQKGVCNDASGIAQCDCEDGYNDDGQGNCSPPSYIVTAVNDDLDQEDLRIVDDGLSERGYSLTAKDTNVSRSSLVEYLETPVTFLYHTGHGTDGAVATSSSALSTSSAEIQVANTVFATCLTLTDGGWKSAFGASAERILGYTDLSYDFTDNEVVNTMLDELDDGRDFLQAWYLANVDIRSLSDRWAAYVREGESITEYSARSNNSPSTARSSTFAPVADTAKARATAKVRATPELLGTQTGFELQTEVLPRVSSDFRTTEITADFASAAARRRNAGSLSDSEAIAAATEWLESTDEGLPADAEFDTVVSVDARGEDGAVDQVGIIVLFARIWEGYPIRSNGRAHRLTVFVDSEGVAASTRYWPMLDITKAAEAPEVLLAVSEAVRIAAPQIGQALKSNDATVDLVEAEPVFGAPSRSGGDVELRPAYDVTSADGFHFIVDAATGELIF